MAKKMWSASLTLLVANMLIFLIDELLNNAIKNTLLLDAGLVWSQPYTLITSMFLHDGAMHLFFNMWALFMFGPLIEQRIGTRRFYTIYFLSGIIGSLIFISGIALGISDVSRALGASGAIMGIIGTTIMLMPDLKILMFFIIPMSLRTAGIIFVLLDILGIFFPMGMANTAHLGGLAAGLLYGWVLLRKKKTYQQKFTVVVQRKGKAKEKKTSIMMDDQDIDDYLKHGRL